ncbi:hypothetical protein FRC0104_02450 [Corynebacterium diphtheriae]|nr:hypothetical protein FRC031641_02309 [Corynebacterium diphtheriae]CAB0623017.1 hypothetical protein CIP107535_02258 [Corynebacterium diphtheriae]CAB0624103.1 hypothetical protein CIP107545_02339 [Corynebacterium diphtheriae]CAB0668125.1 hypothetical protein CIP107565_02222 [Corynebacterium diphtheriae]CAB0766489.1 hypothetical protein FRC0104_02450 [Corynebacterium diphtheriae]
MPELLVESVELWELGEVVDGVEVVADVALGFADAGGDVCGVGVNVVVVIGL